jgi:hypothetical protein
MGGTVAGAPVTWLLCSARKDSMSSVAGVSCAADQTQEKGSSRYLESPYYSALASDGEDRRQRITGAGNIHTRCFVPLIVKILISRVS